MTEAQEETIAFGKLCAEKATPLMTRTQVALLPGGTLLSLARALYHQSDALLLCARRLNQITPVDDTSDDGDRLVRSLANALATVFEWNTYMEKTLTAFAEEYPIAPYPEQA